MKFKEIQQMSISDLQQALAAARSKLRELRFKDANRQLKDVREIREQRKLTARLLTALKITTKQ